MRPGQLQPENFERYAPHAREFAVSHLSLLQQLPIAICPSFLEQIQAFETGFPAEQATLQRQCNFLLHLPEDRLVALLEPFTQLSVPAQLEAEDWINAPATFILKLSAYLWSSGQLDRFRTASVVLLQGVPDASVRPNRLTLVVLGQAALPKTTPALQKLRRQGVTLTALQSQQMSRQIFEAFRQHAAESGQPYAHWYVDGGEPWKEGFGAIPGTIAVNYPELNPVRIRTLHTMEQIVESGNAGAEDMRTRLAGINAKELDTNTVTEDPVLRQFYTDLFTKSSGPQIFSTTFVQWTGRELARRAQPRTMLLRYAPRQLYQAFNELLRQVVPQSSDPEGSLRDAEMGAYYTWIEMNRITAPGSGSYFAWLEGTSIGVVIGNRAPAGTQCDTPLNLEQVLKTFC
jgi:hypothetical protein